MTKFPADLNPAPTGKSKQGSSGRLSNGGSAANTLVDASTTRARAALAEIREKK